MKGGGGKREGEREERGFSKRWFRVDRVIHTQYGFAVLTKTKPFHFVPFSRLYIDSGSTFDKRPGRILDPGGVSMDQRM